MPIDYSIPSTETSEPKDKIFHSMHSWGLTSTATAFQKQPGHSIQDMNAWLEKWGQTVFTYAILLTGGGGMFQPHDNVARNAFLKKHVVRIEFEPSTRSGNRAWMISTFLAVRREGSISPKSPFYERDMKLDCIVDLLFRDAAKNELGGMLYANFGPKLNEQNQKNAEMVHVELKFTMDQIMASFDKQANPQISRFATGLTIRLESGETGQYVNGQWIPDDKTKDSFPAFAFLT